MPSEGRPQPIDTAEITAPDVADQLASPERAEAQRLVLTDHEWADALTLWDFHQMHHEPRPCDVAIGLGSHDLSVSTVAAEAYLNGFVPTIVFTGANSPTTVDRFPQGEAVAYLEHAVSLGVPAAAILVEMTATNTALNISRSRELLDAEGITVSSALLVSKPYEQRRAYATARKLWPEVDFVCASAAVTFAEYIDVIGDCRLVVDMLVGTLQRLLIYPAKGFLVETPVPARVRASYERLVAAGFTSRLAKLT